MATLRILDIELSVPNDVRITTEPPEECRVFHTLEGPSVDAIRTTLENDATARGYQTRRTEHTTYLERGEQRIEVYQIQHTRLGIRVDDAEALPLSQVFTHEIGLAGLVLPIPVDAKVAPGRERHDPRANSWSAEWRIYSSNARDVSNVIHDALIQTGLQSGGVWPPPTGGITRWKIEASSAQQLVQVFLKDTGAHLDLTVIVIRERVDG